MSSLFILLTASSAYAQPKLGWDQPATNLSEASSFTYKYYADGSTAGTNLTATCTGTVSPFQCAALFPTFTPGQHTLVMSTTSVEGLESPKSSPLGFTVPNTPAKLRIIP